jgi:MoxR-like ATPase
MQDQVTVPRERVEHLRARMGKAIIGQRDVVERLLIGLLANGN